MGYLNGLGTIIIVALFAAGLAGWGIIELSLWLFSFVHISVG